MHIPFEGKTPQVADHVFIAPTAVLIGDVHVEEGASIWFGAVLRADHGTIRIGAGSSIQDNTTIHVPTGGETVIGADVTIGHGAVLEGCRLGARTVVGMNAVVLQGAEIGEQVMIAAGSVVGENAHIPANTLAAGAPAQVKKTLGGSARQWIETAAAAYHDLRARYLQQGIDKLSIHEPTDSQKH